MRFRRNLFQISNKLSDSFSYMIHGNLKGPTPPMPPTPRKYNRYSLLIIPQIKALSISRKRVGQTTLPNFPWCFFRCLFFLQGNVLMSGIIAGLSGVAIGLGLLSLLCRRRLRRGLMFRNVRGYFVNVKTVQTEVSV